MNRSLIAILAVLAAVSVRAASVSYTGAPRGVWEKAENWTPKGVPTAADDVTIPSGRIVRAEKGPIAVKSLTVSGAGTELHLGKASLAPQVLAKVAGDLSVAAGAKLFVYAGAMPDCAVLADKDRRAATAALYANATVVSIGGAFNVSGGATVHPENDPVSGAAVFFRPRDLNLAADGTIDTVRRGWSFTHFDVTKGGKLPPGAKEEVYQGKSHYYTYAFGAGHSYNHGGGYGGTAFVTTTVKGEGGARDWTSGLSYGGVEAPFLPGSPGGIWANCVPRGSGSIVVLATGRVSIAGRLNADGGPHVSYKNVPGPSGGGIWVCGGNVDLAPTASVSANGAPCLYESNAYPGAGGGGRIAIGEGLEPSDWDLMAAAGPETPAGFVLVPFADRAPVTGAELLYDKFHRAPDGTSVRVISLKRYPQLTTAAEPLQAIAKGVTYGVTYVGCGRELAYEAPAEAYDPGNPDGIAYPCIGWSVSNPSGEVARGKTTVAKFTPEVGKGPYTLTWRWGKPKALRHYRLSCAGGGTVTVNGKAYRADVSLASAGKGETDRVSAVAASGFRFVGWVGLPTGFSSAASVDVPVEVGGVVTALFEPEKAASAAKTWIGGEGRWDDPEKWSPSGVPTLADDVTIGTGTCQVAYAAIARSITVGKAGALWLFARTDSSPLVPQADNADVKEHRHLFVAKDFRIAGKAVVGGAGARFAKPDLKVGGDLVLEGGALVGTHDAKLQPGGTRTVDPSAVFYEWTGLGQE